MPDETKKNHLGPGGSQTEVFQEPRGVEKIELPFFPLEDDIRAEATIENGVFVTREVKRQKWELKEDGVGPPSQGK